MELSNPGADSGGQSDRRARWETSLGDRARGSARNDASAWGRLRPGARGAALLPVGAQSPRLSLAAEEGALPAGIVTAYPPEQ